MGDTHDNLSMIDKAIERLNREKVELVLHTGDYVSGFVIPRFKALNARLIGVFGNNDGDRERLRSKFGENSNLEIRGSFGEVVAGSVKVALLHGVDGALLNALIEGGCFDVVVYGHTHRAEIRKEERTLVINPGEVCGYVNGKTTVAVLDTTRSEARIVEL
jgi:putative phosphoesterase